MAGHVFISYVHEDLAIVERLVRSLESRGVEAWFDRSRLGGGERWRDAIRHAIRDGALFVGCFSSAFENKNRSYMHEEITLAVDELRQRPSNRAWFIPVLLDVSQVPDIRISSAESLRDLQWVDLRSDWDAGIAKIIHCALTTAAPEAGDLLLLGRWVAQTTIEGVRETVEDVELQRFHEGRLLGTMRNRDLGLDYDFMLVRVAENVWSYSVTSKAGVGLLDHGSGIISFHSVDFATAEGVAYGVFGSATGTAKVTVTMQRASVTP